MFSNISERVIEDIFVADKSIIGSVLNANPNDLSLIARQKKFSDKKILDLLYLYQNELLLLELKAVPFYKEIIEQINHYCNELIKLQNQTKLIQTKINKVILVTDAQPEHFKTCEKEGIKLIKYSLEDVLQKYYENFKELSAFLKIQPGNWGVTRLYLLKKTLKLLSEGKKISEICEIEDKAEKTITNRIAVASLLNLVEKNGKNVYLTKLGREVVKADDETIEDRFTDLQVAVISEFVKENPFSSQITFSILSVVETVFILSKAEYPVKYDNFQDFFVRSLGKETTWQTDKAKLTGTYHFANYAEELGFITKVNNHLYINPLGVKAILILQLNRSIQLINAK